MMSELNAQLGENEKPVENDKTLPRDNEISLERVKLPELSLRDIYLERFGLASLPPKLSARVDDAILQKLFAETTRFENAQAMERPTIDDPKWVNWIVDRSWPPTALAMVTFPKGFSDDLAKELITKAISGDPRSKIYGGYMGTFVVLITAETIKPLAEIKAVDRIY